jgi:predicted aspartyl protease
MKKGNRYSLARLQIAALLLMVVVQPSVFGARPGPSTPLRAGPSTSLRAGGAGWERKEVNWRIYKDRQIKAIYYPADQNLPLLETRVQRKPAHLEQRIIKPQAAQTLTATDQIAEATVFTNVIDSPPIDGFVPYVAVAITDERSVLYDADAYTENSVAGDYLPGRENDYVIGIFDTGATAHIINSYDAVTTGISYPDFVTSLTVTLLGATGQVDALVSQPLGVFADGLAAIDSNTLIADDSNMVGQSNVAIIVGDIVESPNLPTVVGSPLAFFFTTVIENSKAVTLTIDGNEISSPNIRLHQHDSNNIPVYSNKIYLELRPTSAYAVQYNPCFELLGDTCPEGDGEPTTPSVVFGSLLDVPQSLFFIKRTDLAHGNRTSQQKKFMFDTGAQITVISESQAAELELLQNDPNFYVEIVDVSGQHTIADGYYVELLEITAIPSWLSFTNVPVVVIDVDSPEGGILEGIIGMNLFVDMDFYIRGGGLYGQEAPYIKFAFLPAGLLGDIAPAGGDGIVDMLDLAALAEAWLANPLSANWNGRADMVGDAIINFRDFAILAQNWMQ